MQPPEPMLWEAAVLRFSYPVGTAEAEDLAFGPLESKSVLLIASSPVGAGMGERPRGREKQGNHTRHETLFFSLPG